MPIKLDDPNALEQLTEKLSKRRQLQEMMKEVNAVIRSSKSDDAKIDFIMKKCGKSREEALNFLHPSESWCDPGFAAWELATTIRRLAASARESGRSNAIGKPPPERKKKAIRNFRSTVAGSWTTFRPIALQIFFDRKPDADVRTRLKQNGFRWAPNSGAWQSYRHGYTLDWAKREFNAGGAQ